ncbi:uncharacterized protein LOC125947759 [Dermacentor silvarum]|uniref:uncharacterized protein LOC125947759 n=1 Tax=Dermacentor silvarum TaxID=543639 RepID=UPI002100D53E|nr:uncharacterized protein LOC125947759 [Dermacentor silvarum]
MASEDAPGPNGPHAVHNVDDKRGSAESIEPPERRARLVVTLVCSLILVVVFTMIIYRMINEKGESVAAQRRKANQKPLRNSVTAYETPQRSARTSHIPRVEPPVLPPHTVPPPPHTDVEKAPSAAPNKSEETPVGSTSETPPGQSTEPGTLVSMYAS